MSDFVQVLDPLGGVGLSTAVALMPLAVLLIALAGLRLPAWVVVVVTSVVVVWLAVMTWRAPLDGTLAAYGLGAATGLWSVGWIIFWGVVLYHTLQVTGAFDVLRRWLLEQAGPDIRVQTILVAWAFGALLEGLVGFGYPWAVVAPILITLGLGRLPSVRLAALANNAPVSFGALGAPVIALAAVTGLPADHLAAEIGQITAVLALAPPFLLIYLVSGRAGLREGWPLGAAAALGYVAGQLPTSQFLGPYLPGIVGAVTSFVAVALLLLWWAPPTVRRAAGSVEPAGPDATDPWLPRVGTPRSGPGGPGGPGSGATMTMTATATEAPTAPLPAVTTGTGRAPLARGLVPLGILVGVVLLWTGPWSPLPELTLGELSVTAGGSLGGTVAASFSFAPFAGGTAILVAWVAVCLYLRPTRPQVRTAFRETGRQMWAALLVAPLVFGIATVFNYAGLANSMARGVVGLGPAFILVAPLLGWVAVAMSGSNTSANTIFGVFQMSVGRLLGAPPLLFPALNSVGAAVGKPVAPQTASVGVATTGLTGDEGRVIRYNAGWTLALLTYVVAVGLLFYLLG